MNYSTGTCAADAVSLDASQTNGAAPDTGLHMDALTMPVRLCNLPPLNAIASHVMLLAADADTDLKALSQVIEADPAFASDILFLANSALFGFPSRMHAVRHAIAILGLERVRALAVTVAMRGVTSGGSQLVHQCWRHSAACAIVCGELGRFYDYSGERAFTAGIMHDVGRLGLLKTYPQDMTPVLTRQYGSIEEVLEAERAALQVDHARAGSYLVEHWTLPDEFGQICEHHHEAPDDETPGLLHLVQVACRVADALGFWAVELREPPSYEQAIAPLRARLGRRQQPPSEEDLRVTVAARLAAFER